MTVVDPEDNACLCWMLIRMLFLGIGVIFLQSVRKRWEGGGISKVAPVSAGVFQSCCSAAGEQSSFVWHHDGWCLVALLGKVETEKI